MDGRVVDAFFREEGVIIELDSWRFPGTEPPSSAIARRMLWPRRTA
jgi:hypothetical protein